MSQDDQAGPDPAPEPGVPTSTGVAGVDEVVAAVAGLRDRPLEEHVEVFEAAHDRLRRALDPGEPDAP